MAQEDTHNPWRLLLVEDDPDIVTMLSEVLRDEGYEVDTATDGQRGLHLGLTRQYDVLVVDRRLPALDGLDVLARLRSRAVRTPVMLLTAMGTVHDRVDGLDAGADDYLVKPFELDELSARLRALCRRALDRADVLRIGSGQLHVGPREVETADGERIALAAREFALLWVLASRPGTVYSRAELRRAVFQEAPASSIVDTYVYYLRRKLGRQAVHTVRGLGYRLGAL
ncbi:MULTISPECIES: response regulator transcription factor [Streptomyces]|uniref:Response regulator transcription factor n=1 Tax=Streptomyces olivaceus TaxID=47716 RepID=A0ABS7VY10_STROV|nr:MULTISPECIES: response regulator transcription factor [Streptomyces]MBZ6080438.1 response regulator transcription factor [Streptomyces olivaceus]MBZ6087761.1 response regulator transcription factor [Streptomyces olivaceus]MBZ6095403.1 response regulator transcription factor [Streptomyces olivaceus]MBZ6104222.1 response regulator transcription factor [Streptomyces olivaceus]MBZ6109454.1 response regulator transcription factor [Streptomyces olivaceus]